MRVLLDNNVPKLLRKFLPGHFVLHVYDLGWEETPDHKLLPMAEAELYDVLITHDKKIIHQQNNATRKISLVVLNTNSRQSIRHAHEMILQAVEHATSGSYQSVKLPVLS